MADLSSKQVLCFQKELWNEKFEVPMDEEIVLPDYCPDLVKLLKCFVTPRLTAKSLRDGVLSLEGHTDIQVLYLDEAGNIGHYDTLIPFTKRLEGCPDKEDLCLQVKTECGYHSCRAVTERKVDLHGVILIHATASAPVSVPLLAEEQASSFQINQQPVLYTKQMCCSEKSFILEENLDMSQNGGTVSQLLYSDASVSVDEIKPMQNKVLIKGQLAINLLLQTSDGSALRSMRTLLPFSQFVDSHGADDTCRFSATADLQYLELKPERNEETVSGFTLNAKIMLQLFAFCNTTTLVTVDAYATDCAVNTTYETVTVEQTVALMQERYLNKTTFELTPQRIGEVILQQTRLCVGSVEVTDGALNVTGEMQLSLIARENEDGILYLEKNMPFRYFKECDTAKAGMTATVCFTPLSSSYTILGDDRLEVTGEYGVEMVLHKTESVKLLTGIDRDPTTQPDHGNCALIMYYAKDGESVWDIAKRYHGDLSVIRSLNHLDQTTLTQDQTLLIPV